MAINKLTQSVRMPLSILRGSFSQRQIKANELTNKLFQTMNNQIKDDSSVLSFDQLQKLINRIIPDKDIKVIVQNITGEYGGTYDGYCDVLYNANSDIRAISINLGGTGRKIKSKVIPIFIHEFQHVSDDLFHPKYLSRLQSLTKKGLNNPKYDDFYDKYYYCEEVIESKQDKKDALKIIKNKTKKFLKGLNISDKMDIIQDIRYSLISEITAYRQEGLITKQLQSKGINIDNPLSEDAAKGGMFVEKINLLKTLAMEYMNKERAKHASHLNKSKKCSKRY